jgi:hypothetical protein
MPTPLKKPVQKMGSTTAPRTPDRLVVNKVPNLRHKRHIVIDELPVQHINDLGGAGRRFLDVIAPL